jgi:hypothetical protein
MLTMLKHTHTSPRSLVLLLEALTMAIVLAACALAGPSEPGVAGPPSQGTVLSASPPTGTPGAAAITGTALPDWRRPIKPPSSKWNSALFQLYQAHQVGQTAEAARTMALPIEGDRVEVAILAQSGQVQVVTSLVGTLGGRIQSSYKDLIEAFVPVAALPTLIDHDAVKSVDRVSRSAVGGPSRTK